MYAGFKISGVNGKVSGRDDEIRRMAVEDFAVEAAADAGLLGQAEVKALRARHAERVADLDTEQGTAAITYQRFHEAHDQGADCRELVELRNGMHPKDPLRNAAVQDLRAVGCYSTSSTRRTVDE